MSNKKAKIRAYLSRSWEDEGKLYVHPLLKLLPPFFYEFIAYLLGLAILYQIIAYLIHIWM